MLALTPAVATPAQAAGNYELCKAFHAADIALLKLNLEASKHHERINTPDFDRKITRSRKIQDISLYVYNQLVIEGCNK
jgi:uridine kinase